MRLQQPVADRRVGQVVEHVHVLPAGAQDVPGHAQVGDLRLMHTRLAQALHAQQDDLEPGRLVRVGAAGHAAAEVVADGHRLLGPVAGQGLDGPRRHAALGRSPLRSLGDAVFLAHAHRP